METAAHVELPINLKGFLSIEGLSKAVANCHLLGPDFFSYGSIAKTAVPGMDYELEITASRRKQYSWFAVWNQGDNEAKIYATCWNIAMNTSEFTRTAPNICSFFWDLASSAHGC